VSADRPTSAGRPSIADTMAGGNERVLRQGGRDFIVSFYTALRSLKLYPVENATAQRALDDLTAAANALLQLEDDLEIRLASDFVFVNSTRLRLGLDNYASFSHVLGILRQCGVGRIRVDAKVDRREWQGLVSLLLSFSNRADPNKLFELQQKMLQASVVNLHVEAPVESEDDTEDQEKSKEIAKRTYERSVNVTKGALRQRHQGSDQQRADGPQRLGEEGETRGAEHRGPGAQQRSVAGRPDHHPRL
jgi:hypothetical protein